MLVLTRRAVLAGGTLAALPAARKPPARAAVADAPPDLTLTEPPAVPPTISFVDGDGAADTLKRYLGSGIVLNFWATWCAPCVAELPSLSVLAGRLATADVVVLPLSSDRGGAGVVRSFYQAHDIRHLPILLDPQGDAMRALNVVGIPATFLIDRQGLLRASVNGPQDWGSDAAVGLVRKLIG